MLTKFRFEISDRMGDVIFSSGLMYFRDATEVKDAAMWFLKQFDDAFFVTVFNYTEKHLYVIYKEAQQ